MRWLYVAFAVLCLVAHGCDDDEGGDTYYRDLFARLDPALTVDALGSVVSTDVPGTLGDQLDADASISSEDFDLLDIDPLDQHPVETAVVLHQAGTVGAGDLADHLVENLVGEVRVDGGEGPAEAGEEDHVGVGGAVLGGQLRTDGGRVAHLGEPAEGGVLNDGFGQGCG